MNTTANGWVEGWTFYKSGGGGPMPDEGEADLTEWVKGFCAAMADYDLTGEFPSIQAALLHYGIDGDLLEDCLRNAESIVEEPQFNRWPSGRPIRGFGTGNLKIGPIVVVLPEAANDEIG